MMYLQYNKIPFSFCETVPLNLGNRYQYHHLEEIGILPSVHLWLFHEFQGWCGSFQHIFINFPLQGRHHQLGLRIWIRSDPDLFCQIDIWKFFSECKVELTSR